MKSTSFLSILSLVVGSAVAQAQVEAFYCANVGPTLRSFESNGNLTFPKVGWLRFYQNPAGTVVFGNVQPCVNNNTQFCINEAKVFYRDQLEARFFLRKKEISDTWHFDSEFAKNEGQSVKKNLTSYFVSYSFNDGTLLRVVPRKPGNLDIYVASRSDRFGDTSACKANDSTNWDEIYTQPAAVTTLPSADNLELPKGVCFDSPDSRITGFSKTRGKVLSYAEDRVGWMYLYDNAALKTRVLASRDLCFGSMNLPYSADICNFRFFVSWDQDSFFVDFVKVGDQHAWRFDPPTVATKFQWTSSKDVNGTEIADVTLADGVKLRLFAKQPDRKLRFQLSVPGDQYHSSLGACGQYPHDGPGRKSSASPAHRFVMQTFSEKRTSLTQMEHTITSNCAFMNAFNETTKIIRSNFFVHHRNATKALNNFVGDACTMNLVTKS